MAQKYGLTPEELLAVYQNSILQADPLKIQTILAPGGPVTDQVKNAVLEYQKVADNQPIKIPFATQEGADFFKSLGIQAQFDAQTQVLTLPPFAALTPQQRTALISVFRMALTNHRLALSLIRALNLAPFKGNQ